MGIFDHSPVQGPRREHLNIPVTGELAHLDSHGNLLGTIQLPDDPDPTDRGFYYPYGFDIAPDGSFWVAQPNSANVVHVDPSGKLIARYPVGITPTMVAFYR